MDGSGSFFFFFKQNTLGHSTETRTQYTSSVIAKCAWVWITDVTSDAADASMYTIPELNLEGTDWIGCTDYIPFFCFCEITLMRTDQAVTRTDQAVNISQTWR